MSIGLAGVVADVAWAAVAPFCEENGTLALTKPLGKSNYRVIVPIHTAPGRIRDGVRRFVSNISDAETRSWIELLLKCEVPAVYIRNPNLVRPSSRINSVRQR